MPKLCAMCGETPVQEGLAICERCDAENKLEDELEDEEAEMEVTKQFGEEIREAWGDPRRVAEVAFKEVLRQADELGGDYDDQVQHALTVGVLAGEMKDKTPDEFIAAFKEKVLNDK